MKTVLFPIFTSFFLAGCVGVGPVVTKTSTTKVAIPAAPYGNPCPTKEIGVFSTCKQREGGATTIEDIRAIWGEPKSRDVKDGQDRLTYNRDIAWRGLVVFVIVPIPLMLPVGHNEITLTFENDKLSQISSEYGEGNYAICGLHSEGPDPFGCLIWH